MARVSTGSEEPDALGRPVGPERGADDPFLRDGSPEAAVVGRPTVVAHHEVVTGGNRDLARGVTAVRARARADERLLLELAVEHHAAVADLEVVARARDYALDEVDVGALARRLQADLTRRGWAAAAHVLLLRTGRRVEHHNVADVGVREALAD